MTQQQPNSDPPPYGVGDASFRAAGEETGIQRLVEAFYAEMDSLPEARRIRRLHPRHLSTSIDKLARFLCGWLGGPKRYAEKYGPISIPRVHRRFPIGAAERDAWLLCMERALADQPYPAAFRQYLLVQLQVPAERIVAACAAERD
ncbi:MAG: group II truncated hemoglobin [Proteobacteria bacterium]|nr:group II truncated hemoglobin [Pseudomonadota bacterium]